MIEIPISNIFTILELLLKDYRLNINKQDKQRNTHLYYACEFNKQNNYKNTTFHFACLEKFVKKYNIFNSRLIHLFINLNKKINLNIQSNYEYNEYYISMSLYDILKIKNI